MHQNFFLKTFCVLTVTQELSENQTHRNNLCGLVLNNHLHKNCSVVDKCFSWNALARKIKSQNERLDLGSLSYITIGRHTHTHTFGSADPEHGPGQNNKAFLSCGSTYNDRGELRQSLLHAHTDWSFCFFFLFSCQEAPNLAAHSSCCCSRHKLLRGNDEAGSM